MGEPNDGVESSVEQLIRGELRRALELLEPPSRAGAASMEDDQQRVFAARMCLSELQLISARLPLAESAQALMLSTCALYWLDRAKGYSKSPAREHLSALCELIAP